MGLTMMMMMVNQLLRFLVYILVLVVLVHSKDQSGFISIDCGADEGYTDESTTIIYTPDDPYTNTGINVDISSLYKVPNLRQQLKNVRSFPHGTKNCYTLKPDQGKDTNYIVRAYFMYGNYDSKDDLPTFDLHLGVDIWDTIILTNSSQVVVKEIIHTPSTDHLFICLVNTGYGTPFISGLELRHLDDSLYTRESGSLDLLYRYYTYTTSLDQIRYKDDVYDRQWEPMYLINGSLISTASDVSTKLDAFNLPSSVMKAAIVTANVTTPITFFYAALEPNAEFQLYFHVAELSSLRTGQVREFNITANGRHLYGPYTPLYLTSDTIYTTKTVAGPELNVSIQSTEKATLPPLLNAIEIFSVKMLEQRSTDQSDVDAIMDIKSFYHITMNWQGDPCVPKAYSWSGVNCSYDSSSPRIVSLNLSSSGLNGTIPNSISDLTALQILDLSNNELSGQIPSFLAEIPSLKTLKLEGNSFSGSVPESLQERSQQGSLSLSVGKGLCSSSSCSSNKKSKAFIAPVAACAALVVLLLAGFISFLIYRRRKKQEAMHVQSSSNEYASYNKSNKGGLSRFTYSELTNITSGFQRKLGKGGFGEVFYGCLKDGTPVAVKMLFPSINASEQFSTEVELLMAIRHKNLVSLVGYCEEGTHLALIYEYMASGDLQSVLTQTHSLSWKMRVQIAIDAAQGLDYLYNGCRPPIVHRDVKTPNILLNNNLQAKIADFGLSKIFPDEDKSYVSTRVIGTPGYLDPEYHITQQLNEKSDVYSFGVVLLELITGKSAIVGNGEDRKCLGNWVSPKLECGDIWTIVDQRMQQVNNLNSVWKAIDIAMSCFKPSAVERPSMSQIVTDLKDCLAMELDVANSTATNDSTEMSPMISLTAMDPAPR